MIDTTARLSTHKRGKAGEQAAAAALSGAGLRVVAENVRSKAGEIDLVALEGNTLAFIEVKSWPAYGLENLGYGISAKKQRRIIETAKYFLAVHREYNDRPIRFDVVFLGPPRPGSAGASCIHLRSAFMETT